MSYRKSIEIEGLDHGTVPIPQGTRVGQMVFSSGIPGIDPKTGQIPEDPEEQVRLVFENVRRFMEEAGGNPDHIGRMTVYVQNEEIRDLVNREWVKMFPDPESRPARHATVTNLRRGAILQVELIAVLPEN